MDRVTDPRSRIERTIAERGWSAWASVLRSTVNVGFAAGNNLGIRAVQPAAYLLLNSDTLVRPGALRSLRDAMRLGPLRGSSGPGSSTAGEITPTAPSGCSVPSPSSCEARIQVP